MKEPDFCEAQLQQMTNIEISDRVRRIHGMRAFPIITTTHQEGIWAWDSAFFFPWLGREHFEQRGCNFFIQYKLSKCFETSGAIGWEDWQRPFFRFNLGYQRKREWDLAQRDHLVMLRSEGFLVVYVTNHILELSQLFALAANDRLCPELPVLQVEQDLSNHERISFTPESQHFVLLSKKEKRTRITLLDLFEAGQRTSLQEDLGKILKILMHFEDAVPVKEKGVRDFMERYGETEPRQVLEVWVAWLFLRRYLDLHWWRVPVSR